MRPWIETAALEQTLNACRNLREQGADVLIGRRRERSELKRALVAFEEDAVEEQRVEVDVQIQSAPEALDDGHRSRSAQRIPYRRALARWWLSSTRTNAPSTARDTAPCARRRAA